MLIFRGNMWIFTGIAPWFSRSFRDGVKMRPPQNQNSIIFQGIPEERWEGHLPIAREGWE
jgi:hypothetical protein